MGESTGQFDLLLSETALLSKTDADEARNPSGDEHRHKQNRVDAHLPQMRLETHHGGSQMSLLITIKLFRSHCTHISVFRISLIVNVRLLVNVSVLCRMYFDAALLYHVSHGTPSSLPIFVRCYSSYVLFTLFLRK